MAAPRSPVNNCGKLTGDGDPVMTPTPSEQAAAVLNLIERGVIGWNEPDVVKVLNEALKAGAPSKHRQQRSNAPLKTSEQAPSATRKGSRRKNSFRFSSRGHYPGTVGARRAGATVIYGEKRFKYPAADEWPGNSTQKGWAL